MLPSMILKSARTFLATAIVVAVMSAGVAGAAPTPLFSASPGSLAKRFSAEQTGRVVVGLRRGMSASALSAAEQLGGETVSTVARGGFAVVEPPAGVSAEQFAQQIAGTRGVRYAQPERVVWAAEVLPPTDSDYQSDQWNLKAIGFPAAWDFALGDGVKVAVLDTGIMDTHHEFAGRTIIGTNTIDPGASWRDDFGHGTHVAGIIAATMNNGVGITGIAPHATLMAGKVLDSDGAGTDSSLAEGLYWAADNGADVINMSITSFEYSPALEEACAYARAKGCLIVAAAGNENANRVGYPAVFPGVISVGAIEQTISAPPFRRAVFSNLGYELDIAAPGVAINSSIFNPSNPLATGQYMPWNGTSMASPHVAGVLALTRELNPTLSRDVVEQVLMQRAQDLGDAGRDQFFGMGMVRADEMVKPIAPITPADVDKDIPGLPLAAMVASSVDGTLDSVSDADDVYEVHVLAGSALTCTLTADPGTDFRLELFSRTATSTEATPVASSVGGVATYLPAASGSVFVRVRAITGSGAYSLAYGTEYTPDPDDEIPGTAAASTVLTGTLDRAGDFDDVYAVHLEAGQGITVGLTSVDHSDFDLLLYSPEAESVNSMTGLVAWSGNDMGIPEELSFSAMEAGTYYLDAKAYVGGGQYTLTYKTGNASKLSISGPSTCAWSGSATVSGNLSSSTGVGLAHRIVHVWASTDYTSSDPHWSIVSASYTDLTGHWQTSVNPKRKTWYVAQFSGDSIAASDPYPYSESVAKIITPRAYLTRPTVPRTAYRNRSWTSYGYLRPKHTTGLHSVKISCYRYENKKWVKRRTYYALNYYASPYTTKYKRKMSLPYSGKWKLVASVTGNTTHVATNSYPRYVTVK